MPLDPLAWPGAVVALGIAAMFIFRAPLTRFLDRAKRIGKAGIDTTPSDQTARHALQPSGADELLRQFDNALVLQNEQVIRDELQRRNITGPEERERVLIRFLAASSILAGFERAYALIWGSQLSVLQVLNETGAAGMRLDLLRPWYDQAAAREPAFYQSYSFDQWIGFLEGQRLLTRGNDVAYITLEGKEFLKYLVHQGYTFFRRG